MKRYFNSFILTSLIYTLLLGGFFLFFSNQKQLIEEKTKNKNISLSHIEIIKKEKMLKNLLNQKKVIEKKVIDKKVRKKVVKKEIVKTVKKEPKKFKKKIITKQLKKEFPKAINKVRKIKEKVLVPSTFKATTTDTTISKKIDNYAYEEEFLQKNLLLIKNQIQKNVKYSKRARKLNIQGEVIVQFCILKNGSITDIKALNGHKLLKKSTIEAIHKASSSFPRVSENITIRLPINYKLI